VANETLRFIRIEHFVLDPGPMPVAFQDSTMGPFTHWKLDWIRLTADDGTIGEGPGSIHPIAQASLLADGPLTPAQWWHKLFWMLRNSGHRNPGTSGFLYALDMAMRDILAKWAGQPWHRYMGAQRDAVPVYGSGGGTNLTIDQLVAEMKDMARCGYPTVKMKVGKSFGTRMEEDVERVRAVRAAIGDKVGLAVDGNQTWSAEQARAFAKRIADLNIAWFEEPVHSADRHELRELCRDCPMPVAMGESENHWAGFRDLYECGTQHLQPNPHCLPGFDRWLDALAWAEKTNHLWTAGGFSHLTAMYVATRPDGMVEYLRSIIGHLATCWSNKPLIENGLIHLPTTPGLPVRVDWEGLEKRSAVQVVLDVRR
jgi:L-alanine-DL-glutamate epimerase-like enolase superfamily enzyme